MAQQYAITATATDEDGNYNANSISVTANSKLAAPTNLSVNFNQRQPSELGLARHSANESCYYVEQLVDGTWTQIGDALSADSTTAIIAGTFAASTQYSFRVSAYNSFYPYVYSSPSNVAQVTTGNWPTAPSDLGGDRRFRIARSI